MKCPICIWSHIYFSRGLSKSVADKGDQQSFWLQGGLQLLTGPPIGISGLCIFLADFNTFLLLHCRELGTNFLAHSSSSTPVLLLYKLIAQIPVRSEKTCSWVFETKYVSCYLPHSYAQLPSLVHAVKVLLLCLICNKERFQRLDWRISWEAV